MIEGMEREQDICLYDVTRYEPRQLADKDTINAGIRASGKRAHGVRFIAILILTYNRNSDGTVLDGKIPATPWKH